MRNTLRRSDWTIDGFLAWEAEQETRYEFDGFDPIAMVGAPARHHRIVRNGETALRSRLSRCEVFRETMKLKLAHTVRYPDLMVVCSSISDSAPEVTDPTVIIEVLSDSTARNDRLAKNEEYRAIDSLMHYVMLEQDEIAATVINRAGDTWTFQTLVGPSAVLNLPAIGVSIALPEFYEGLDL